MKFDRADDHILAALQRDGRLTNRELAERVHLSESACLRRVRALEEAGVIDRYVALVNQAKVGLPGNVFVSITLNRQEQADLAAFAPRVLDQPMDAATHRLEQLIRSYDPCISCATHFLDLSVDRTA